MSHPVQYMEAVSFRDMNAYEYYIRSTARRLFHGVECISRARSRKRNPKILQELHSCVSVAHEGARAAAGRTAGAPFPACLHIKGRNKY